MKRSLLQFKFEVRSLLARKPRLSLLYQPFIWWGQYKARHAIDIRECRVDAQTELVIDGFQGSGNSFATVAFKRSQERPVRLAHHLHAPAQVIKAVQLGIPTLVTLREPAGAAVSLVSRWPYVSVRQALRGYITFYQALEPHLGHVVLSPFVQTTQHLDEVIRTVNRRFDTDFTPFAYTEENMQALRSPEKLTSEREEQRKVLKAQKREELQQPDCRALLDEANAVYRRLEPYGMGGAEPPKNQPLEVGSS
jgi:hypothetical protein